jgi:hypothetical protein
VFMGSRPELSLLSLCDMVTKIEDAADGSVADGSGDR